MLIQKNASILVAVVAVVAVFVYIYKDLNKSPDSISFTSQVERVQNSGISLETAGSRDYKVTIDDESINSTQKSFRVPSERVFVAKNLKNVEEPVFKIMTQNIADLSKTLKEDPKREAEWLQLAIYHKNLGDYGKATEILDYVAALWPNDYVPYNNLADLYQFYVKNYPLAEKNWLKVTELKPDYSESYKNLHDLYFSLYPEKREQALPILFKGLERNPKSIDLIIYISRFYKASGDKEKASVYYSKAIAEAKSQGNQQMAASIEAEAAELSK